MMTDTNPHQALYDSLKAVASKTPVTIVATKSVAKADVIVVSSPKQEDDAVLMRVLKERCKFQGPGLVIKPNFTEVL